LESATYPSTTDTGLRKVLEEGSSMKARKDFRLAYSPECEDPGNIDRQVARIPKMIDGFTENSFGFFLPYCLSNQVAGKDIPLC